MITKALIKLLELWSSPKEYISLMDSIPDYSTRFKTLRITINIIFVTLLIFSFTLDNAILLLLLWGTIVYLFVKSFRWIKNLKIAISEKNKYRFAIYDFLLGNHLYAEQNGKFSSSAVFSCEEKQEILIIKAHKKGDIWAKKLDKIDVELEAFVGLSIEEKINRPTVVEYHFALRKPERLIMTPSIEKYTNKAEINLGYGVTYDPVKTPHILISGGTGSGKSIFISYLILELLKSDSTLYIADPKNSDLGSLSHYMGNERVATTPGNIARIVRLAVTEMKERYEYMNENFKYGSNFVDHGYKPVWIVFDEMGAFQASGTDKQSKVVVGEVMDGLKQIILLGRQAGVFILIAAQQMRSETLSTDLRDNLGLRISLGSNSQEGYRMVFGSATPETIPPIEVKGSGLLYMQGSGKESAQYWESPFVDMQNFDFIEELKRYC
ncbi:FtsK/SpoIIIE domain-containing protein [Enterococcus mundtii]|uniref:FtsK/SpoIIIE domain-containing protein n=1 Tax=Enterococcus mundtii TaxID=53346 RepID=UPI000DFA467C|nr:FtsK/SpoIIIE domain-containing protein [Enterococcus mundtii]STD27435.1 FtsK/SpoIIIE family protein [Enterococcus mundtii]